MNTDSAISVADLSHAYGNRRALDGVSFDVAAGQIFGFLGPNGGGKTTLFSLLSTLLPIQNGEISALGFDLAQQTSEYRCRIGVTFQSPSLDRRLTVRENLIHQGHLYGMRGRKLHDICDELLNRFQVADRASDIVDTLSGGLKRRAELAKCLIHQPALLLLDEPSTGLDPGGRVELWRCLEELRSEQGVTIVVTTHLMEEAERSDELALIDRGKIVAGGSPSELRASIPGESVTLTADQPAELKSRIESQFSCEVQRVGESLRIRNGNGRQLLDDLVQNFDADFRSISLEKATLEDVFIMKTGRAISDEDA